jgi:hypothetical protein
MGAYQRAQEIVADLTAAGLRATADARNANPPCVLVVPPGRSYDVNYGYSAEWHLWVLAPGEGTADTWKALDSMLAVLETSFALESADANVQPPIGSVSPLGAYDCIYREPIQIG